MDTNDNTETTVTPETQVSPAPTSDACDRLAAARQFAMDQYDKIRRAAGAQLDNVRAYTYDARRQINEGWDATCAKAQDLHKAGEEYVKANPTGSVLGAVGLGLIVGLLLGRSRS